MAEPTIDELRAQVAAILLQKHRRREMRAKQPSDSPEQRHAYTQRFKSQRPSYAREYRRALRKEVVDHYGGRCVCCGETELLFLTLDHIGGGGGEHRAQFNHPVYGVYRDLKRRNFPGGFRVLCHNCHNAFNCAEGCPHERADALGLGSAL